MQQTKILVNGYSENVPIGPGLMRQGITSNLVLSQKRADNVMNFMTSKVVNAKLSVSAGVRRCKSRRFERHGSRGGTEPARGTDAAGSGN
jgi:flagellar motor protein MotB